MHTLARCFPQSTLVLQSSTTPCLCEHHGTEPHYTRSVLHVEACRHTGARCTPPQSTLVLQSPTPSCLFDMLQNVDITRSDVPHPTLINPSGTEPHYTMSVWDVKECRHNQVRCTPSLMNPSATEPYHTMSVWHVEECRHTKGRSIRPTNWTQCCRALLHYVSLTCAECRCTQVRFTPPHSMSPMLQSSTTPCQFDM